MLPVDAETGPLFLRLLAIVETLRSPGGCPWDREQTPRTIAPYLVEEAHEVLEAVETGDAHELCGELGDVLLEIALLSHMAREEDQFTVADALRSICAKLVRRHPHVFGKQECPDAAAVQQTWSQIKAAENRHRGTLEGVPRRLPALHRARRVSEKAAGVGFDWADAEGVLAKVEEELAELKQAMKNGGCREAEEELGDLLFAVTNLGRHLGADPEATLHQATERFLDRFALVELALGARGRHPADATMDELEALWLEAKRALRSP
jgi:MazG family protein